VSKQARQGDAICIEGEDARHLGGALRANVGDYVEVMVEEDGPYVSQIKDMDRQRVETTIVKRLRKQQDPPISLVLYQGMAKGERMDFAVQKAVELGVQRVVPFSSDNCVVKMDVTRAKRKRRRWQRIAEEAAKQCFRDRIPDVSHPMQFEDLVDICADGTPELMVFPYEREDTVFVKDLQVEAPESAGVIIGPEGGFEPAEAARLVQSGANAVSLGPRILRTETAGMVALTLLGSRFGDLNREKVERI